MGLEELSVGLHNQNGIKYWWEIEAAVSVSQDDPHTPRLSCGSYTYFVGEWQKNRCTWIVPKEIKIQHLPYFMLHIPDLNHSCLISLIANLNPEPQLWYCTSHSCDHDILFFIHCWILFTNSLRFLQIHSWIWNKISFLILSSRIGLAFVNSKSFET